KGSAHRWLVQWIMNPKVHHPRTRMPITHLKVEEASDLADWLLAQDAGWNEPDVAAQDMSVLKNLVRVNIKKLVPPGELERIVDNGFSKEQLSAMAADADERVLEEGKITEDTVKWYIGKKAINRIGCFGCHSIPGFEGAKPIGTPLN